MSLVLGHWAKQHTSAELITIFIFLYSNEVMCLTVNVPSPVELEKKKQISRPLRSVVAELLLLLIFHYTHFIIGWYAEN